MTIQAERLQEKRLNRFGLQIITSFWDEHTVRRRASDGSLHDDIVNGVILDKKYVRNGKLKHTETLFNPLMQYSFVVNEKLKKSVRCPNCGWEGKTAEFMNGCPYCGAYYSISYSNKQAAAKRFAEKKAKQPGLYLFPLLLCLGLFIGLSLLIVRATGRTFGLFDVLKGAGFGTAFGLAAFYCVYLKSVHAITGRAEENYRRQSAMLQEFERGLKAREISLNGFFTSLNAEMTSRIFSDAVSEYGDIVDWDILDYDNCLFNRDSGGGQAEIEMTVRVLRMRNDRLRSRQTKARAVMKTNAIQYNPLGQGAPVAHCHACGSSIDLSQPVCGYCGTPIRYKQPLYLTELRLGG